MKYHIVEAELPDLEHILDIQKRAFQAEADIYGSCSVPPLSQTIEEIRKEFSEKLFLKAVEAGVTVGSVRAFEKDGSCMIEKLIVEPGAQNKGIGRSLMLMLERKFPGAKEFELMTGHKSLKNIHLYSSLGYSIVRREKKTDTLELVYMVKKRVSPVQVTAPRSFDREAAMWDAEPRRVKLAHDIVDAMQGEIKLNPGMDIMDFGCGTGLVGMLLRPLVRSLTCVDNSQGMLDVLMDKVAKAGIDNVSARRVDVSQGEALAGSYDCIVTAMALHHIDDTGALVRQFYRSLRSGGYVCIADLDPDNGRFHEDASSVFHHGFDRDGLCALLADIGFVNVRSCTAAKIEKPSGVFPVFLVIGMKR